MLTYFNPQKFLEAAQYVYISSLSKPYTAYSSTKQARLSTKIPRFENGILTSSIAAAMAAYLYYTDSHYQTLSFDAVSNVQLMLLFREVGRSAPQSISKKERVRSAKEFEKYCSINKIYNDSKLLHEDVLILENLDNQNKSLNLKEQLLRQAYDQVHNAITNGVPKDHEHLKALCDRIGLLTLSVGVITEKLLTYFQGDYVEEKKLDVILLLNSLAEVEINNVKLAAQRDIPEHILLPLEDRTWFSPTAFYNLVINDNSRNRI